MVKQQWCIVECYWLATAYQMSIGRRRKTVRNNLFFAHSFLINGKVRRKALSFISKAVAGLRTEDIQLFIGM
eukprot:scaffold2619_cov129-Cylindrotheca_fusiformis.AAC.1